MRLNILSGAVAAAMLLAGTSGGAQVPGAPVLQNAFSNPGLAFAANFGGSSGQSFYGAAVGWGLRGGALAISGAAGAQRINDATRGAYGARASARVWSSSGGGLGVGAFAGVGSAPRTRTGLVMTNPSVVQIPAGVSVGYRRAIGTKRGISAYVSPFYSWRRTDLGSGTTVSTGGFRTSAGVDFSITTSIGVTAGGEFGSSGTGLFGAALSFVPGGRRTP